jgi:uncharacterized membrane protein YkvA (DUF1232 family)
MKQLKQFFRKNWMLVLSFVYILSPIDLIPGDMATGIGLIDDLVVLIFTTLYLLTRFLIESEEGKVVK